MLQTPKKEMKCGILSQLLLKKDCQFLIGQGEIETQIYC